jgi:hypothetical protein
MFEAEALEFPAFASLPKREKSKIQKVWDTFQQLSQISKEKGMLMPQTFAAKVLDISKQRVNDLVKNGTLETFDVNGFPFVTEDSVVNYAKTERRSGRPINVPTTSKECWKRAVETAKRK